MKKENVVDLNAYRKQREATSDPAIQTPVSDELQEAIQSLIEQLRDMTPDEPAAEK